MSPCGSPPPRFPPCSTASSRRSPRASCLRPRWMPRCSGWRPPRGLIPTAAADHPYAEPMAGGTKRLPRAVREQQMLDAAVQIFSVNGYHETSMDAIAAQAQISKPMLYLYYGSKEELFGACLDRELSRFVEEVRNKIDFTQSPKDLLRNAVLAFLNYIDAN